MAGRNVAFLGLGAMGLPMSLNLQRKGFAVTGWNRTAGRGAPLAEAGGGIADSLAAAVAEADFIVTMLGGPGSVAAVAQGFLPSCRPGALWMDVSTTGPTAAREMAAAAERAGVCFMDTPVMGSVGPATEGTLRFLVGGSEAALVQARPLLEAMGSSVTHLGPVGQGAAAKIVSNMITGTLLAALGEALALSGRLGVEPEQMAELLKNGPAGGPIVSLKLPAMLSGDFTPAFALKWMEKDLGLALKESLQTGAQLPTAAAALGEFAGARAAGYGEQDFAAISAFIRKMAEGPTGE